MANPDQYLGNQDRALVVNARGVLLNDRNVACMHELLVQTPPQNGMLQLAQSGGFTYIPNPGFHGSDEFVYEMYQVGGISSSARVYIQIFPANHPDPYIYAAPDSYSFTPGTPLHVPNSGVLRNDQFPATYSPSVQLVSQPTIGNVSLNPGGGFTFTPGNLSNATSSDSYKFIYRLSVVLANGDQKSSFAIVTLTPRTLQLSIVDPDRQATKIIALNSDDDNADSVEDRNATEVDEVDNDWVQLSLSVQQPSGVGFSQTVSADDEDRVVVEARPRDIRFWYFDDEDDEFKLIGGPLPAEKLHTIYADATGFASQTVSVTARFERQWEYVEGASAEVKLSVITFEQYLTDEVTVDEMTVLGIAPTIVVRTKGEVDWDEVQARFSGSSKLMDEAENELSTDSFELKNAVGIPELPFPANRLRLTGNDPEANRYKVQSEFAGATFESSSVALLPGSATKFRITGQVIKRLAPNVESVVYSYTLLDEIQDQEPMPTTVPPDFSKYQDHYLTLYMQVADAGGNLLTEVPVDVRLLAAQHSGGDERVAGNNLPFQFEKHPNAYQVATIVHNYPIGLLPQYSQIVVAAHNHRIAQNLTGNGLMLSWDVSNPRELYFDAPTTLTLKVWVLTSSGGWAADGTVVEWSDSKGFIKKTSAVVNGRATVEYKLPAYGLFHTPEEALGRSGIYAQFAGYSTTGYVDIKYTPGTTIGSVLSSVGQFIAGDIIADTAVPVRSTSVSGATESARVESALQGPFHLSNGQLAGIGGTTSVPVAASQSLTAQKLLPNRKYRLVINDPTGTLTIDGSLPNNSQEKRFTTGDAPNGEHAAVVRSNGSMPRFTNSLRVAHAITKLEIEAAHEIYEDFARQAYQLPPIPVADFVWNDISLNAGILLYEVDEYPELANPATRQAMVDMLNAMKVSAEAGAIQNFEFYTGVPSVEVTDTAGNTRQMLTQAVLKIASKETVARYYQLQAAQRDFLWGAFAGSDDLDVALLGDVTLGVAPVVGVWTDIRDVGKNALRLLPVDLGMGPYDWRETTIAALGIATEFVPPADLIVDAYRTIFKIGKASTQAMQFFLAFEPLFTTVFKTMLSQPVGPPLVGTGGFTSAAFSLGSETVYQFLRRIGIDDLPATTLDRFVKLLGELTDGDARRIVTNVALATDNPDIGRGLTKLLEKYPADAVVRILKDISNELDGVVVARALELVADSARADSVWSKLLNLDANDLAVVLKGFGRVLASPSLQNNVHKIPLTGRNLLESAVSRVEIHGYFHNVTNNQTALNNLKYLAEDLGNIARHLDRTAADPENLNWVLHKLSQNTGNDNLMSGKLAEISAMAKILIAAPQNSNIQLTRRFGAPIGGDGMKDSWTDFDIFDQVSQTFYEVKTTAAAAMAKLKKPSKTEVKDTDQIANEAYSQVFAKMLIHQKNFPGKPFQLWTDTGGNDAALRGAMTAAIDVLVKKMKINDEVLIDNLNSFTIVNHPTRYIRP